MANPTQRQTLSSYEMGFTFHGAEVKIQFGLSVEEEAELLQTAKTINSAGGVKDFYVQKNNSENIFVDADLSVDAASLNFDPAPETPAP